MCNRQKNPKNQKYRNKIMKNNWGIGDRMKTGFSLNKNPKRAENMPG